MFIRHGEKGPDGNLTDAGKASALELGRQLYPLLGSDVMVRSTKLRRVIETMENVVLGADIDADVVQTDLLGKKGSFSEEFMRLYKQSSDLIADLYFEGKLVLPNQISTTDVAAGIAKCVLDELKIGNPETVFLNGTHQFHTESFLFQLGGIPKFSQVGGPFKTLEYATFDYRPGDSCIDYNLRGRQYRSEVNNIRRVAENGKL